MTDLQVIGAIFGAVAPLYGSLLFIHYKLGRMEQRIINAVNGQKCDSEGEPEDTTDSPSLF